MAGSLKVWDGSAWQYAQLPQGGVTIQTTAPTTPALGTMWMDSTDTTPGDISDTGWIDATSLLTSGWTNYSTPTYQGARYRRKNGIVYVQGLIKGGTMQAATGAFSLPVGFRPAAQLIFASMDGANSIGRLDVFPGGPVQPVTGSNVYFSINCYFPADA